MKHALGRILLAVVISPWIATSARAGFDEGVAAYKRGDYSKALEELLPVAEQGDAEVQTGVGYMYANGLGVPQNYGQAAKWYSLAAEQGNTTAQFNLALMYHKGRGVPQGRQAGLRTCPA